MYARVMPESVSTTTPSVDANHAMMGTKFRLQLVMVNESGYEQVQEVARIEREGVEMETLGLTLAEGKLIFKKIQEAWSRSRSGSAMPLPGLR